MTPLHCAAKKGELNCVQLLLDRGADVNMLDWIGWTPLRFSVQEGHSACARLLLERGASVHTATEAGLTPLHLATTHGRLECARLLLERGAAVGARSREGITPLHSVAQYGRTELAFELLWHGADVALADNDGDTPAALAARHQKQSVTDLLAAWSRGELREWRREAHALFPAAFRADVAAALLALTSSIAAHAPPSTNPLRILQSHHLLEPLFSVLLVAHMGGPPRAPTAAQLPAQLP